MRELVSFPTRRSSDLGDGYRVVVKNGAGRSNAAYAQVVVLAVFIERVVDGRRGDGETGHAHRDDQVAANQGHARSEEHTYELQALRHLVFRLQLVSKD